MGGEEFMTFDVFSWFCSHPWNVLSYEFSTKNGFNESKYNNMTGIERLMI